LDHVGIGNNFTNRFPVTQQLKESIDKWDCMKLKSTVKEIVTRLNRHPTEWRKIFVSYTSDKEFITRLYRELTKLTSQRINNPLNK
jgi:phage-related protein